MRTIAILQQKGGVGKTTLATNLGAAAHLAGHKTLVLDLDKQSSAFDWLRARGEGSRLKDLDVRQADKVVTLDKLRMMTRGYDVVILDGPARLGDMTMSAAVAADLVLIPLRAGPLDYWASEETLSSLDKADAIRVHLGMEAVPRLFVLNGAPPKSRILESFRTAIADHGKLADVTIGSRNAFPFAMVSGESVLTLEKPGLAGKEIQRLFHLVMGTDEPAAGRDDEEGVRGTVCGKNPRRATRKAPKAIRSEERAA